MKKHHFNGQIDFRTADGLSWLKCNMRMCNVDEIVRQISLKASQINMSSLIHQTVNFPLNKLCSCVPGSPGTGGGKKRKELKHEFLPIVGFFIAEIEAFCKLFSS